MKNRLTIAVLMMMVLIFTMGMASAAYGESPSKWTPSIQVAVINDYLTCFYDGRETGNDPDWVKTNGDMSLGVCSYALHKGDKAIVFDTMVYPEQAKWIKDYLEKKGIKHFTVINSHWHADHIAGNYLYKNSDIISSALTRQLIVQYKESIQSGEMWHSWGDPNFPGFEVTLPNRTFDEQMTVYLDDLKIELYHGHIHTPDHVVAYIPKDNILLAGDAVEDTVNLINAGEEPNVPQFIANLKKLKAMDIARVYPCHGSFETIKNGGYDKGFIDAMIHYNTQLITKLRDKDYLTSPIQDYISEELAKGVLTLWDPYLGVHDYSRFLMYNYYKDKPLPVIPAN